MAEDYACPKFNSYNSGGDLDECSLYIKNIPASLSREAFVALMSENGRKVVRSKLFDPRPDCDVTTGLVSFELAKDAAEAMQRMNKKPPLNLVMTYAKKKSNPKKGDHYDDSSSFSSQPQRAPPPISSAAAASTSTANPPFGAKGRGSLLNSLKFPALRIVLDGEKRSSFAPNSATTEVVVHSQPPDIPQLVENPFLKCLACDNVGKFSCSTCKRPYCSSRCQVENWPKHKLSCASSKRSRDSSYVSESSGSDSEKKSAPPPPPTARSFTALKTANKQPARPTSQVVKIKDIQTYVLPKDKHIKVKVSHILNPSKFWVQPSTAQDLLSQMERDLALSVKQEPSSHDPTHVYCINRHDSCKRVAILEVKGGRTALVRFLDYGSTATVQLDQLFLLPSVFKEISYQAVCCKLGDTGEEGEVAWSEDDTQYFQMQSSDNRSYTALVLKQQGGVYEVNLSDDDGISLYSIISGMKNLNLSSIEVKESVSDSAGSKQSPTIPSVLSSVKSGEEVSFVVTEFSGDQFWGLMDDGSAGDQIAVLDSLLQSLDTKDYSLCAEERDVLAGFSLKFNQFYRCIVLKRMRERFLVHFIDYGNQEEISKLCELTAELKSRPSYCVCCPKPDALSLEECRTLFSQPQSVSVIQSEDNRTKLSFLHKNCKMFLDCFPWHHSVLQVKPSEPLRQMGLSRKSPVSQRPVSVSAIREKRVPKTPPSQSVAPRPVVHEEVPAKRITSDLVPDLPVVTGTKYCVKVVFIVVASKIYVQLREDESKLEALSKQLNKYCSLKKSDKYSPVKNEIVCCKYKEDGNWYRGQVIGKKGDVYTVFFVDFGNEDKVTDKEMKPLPENLSSHKFALCASLLKIDDGDLKELLSRLTQEYWEMKVIDKSSSPVQVMLYQRDVPLTDLIKKRVVRTKASLSRQKLPERCEVMISHSEKDVVYVQQQKDTKAINDFINKINSDAASMPLAKEISIDGVYCALFKDGLWYRTSVNKELPSNQYLVNFLDYGNCDTVELKNLKELPEEFFKFPVFCLPVIPTNIKISQMQEGVWYPVEVTGERSGAQLVKILNVQMKTASLSSIKKTEFEKDVDEAMLSHNEGDIYYFLRSSDSKDLEAVCEKLKDCPGDKLNPEDLSVESVVCAKSSDGCWYRGAVSRLLDGASCIISFVDFGNSETVPFECIKKLPEDLMNYPIFAVPCRISNVENAKDLVVLNQLLTLKTVGKSEDGVQSVEVVIPKSSCGVEVSSLTKQLLPPNETTEVSVCYIEGEVCYCQKVCDADKIQSLESKLMSATAYRSLDDLPDVGCVICAKFTDNVWYRGSVEEICQSSKSCKICFIDYGNTETISVENMRILPPELNEYPILSIPVKFANFEKLQALVEAGASTFPVQALELSEEGVQLVKIAEPEIKKPTYTSVDAQLLSDLPTEVTVCYEDNGLYYVQKVSDEEPLKQMMATLQNNLEAVQHKPQVGEILCAKYNDGAWYRGMIKKDCGNDVLKVFFVDFGNTEDINKKDMCYLPPSCASLPMFSIPVKLSDSSKHITRLSVNNKYVVKRVDTVADNVQVVRVRPTVDSVSVAAMKPSKLEEDVAAVSFQSYCEDHYFLTKSSDADKIEEMYRLLKDFTGEEIFDVPVSNEILIVRGADKNWHRGCIKVANVRPGFCTVFLVDQGTSEDIPYSELRYLPEQFISFPLFSIKVLISSDRKARVPIGKDCVVHVLKKFNIPTVQVVPHHMLSSLGKHHLPLKTPARVEFCYRDDNVFFVQAVDHKHQLAQVAQEVQACSLGIVHKAKVGELLVAQSSLDNQWYRCCVELLVSCDTYKVYFIDYGNSEVVSNDKLRYFNVKLLKYSPLCIAVKIINLPESFEFAQQHTVVAESLPETNEPQLVKLIPEAVPQQIPPPHEEVSAAVERKHVYDGSSKFVPFPDAEQDILIYFAVAENYVFAAPFNQKNVSDMTRLTAEITQYCNSLTAVSSYEGEPPVEGEMVLAPYCGEWFRAAVVIVEGTDYEVLFVDYGNSERLPITSLRRMTDEFMSLDIQAHLCKLTGFQHKESDSERIKEEIKENFIFRPLQGTSRVDPDSAEVHVRVKEIIEHLKSKNLITM